MENLRDNILKNIEEIKQMIQSRASREEVEIKIKKLDELLKIYLKDL